MEAISEAQYDQLCKACDLFLNEKSFSLERNANSYLHVIREHPIFLKSSLKILKFFMQAINKNINKLTI